MVFFRENVGISQRISHLEGWKKIDCVAASELGTDKLALIRKAIQDQEITVDRSKTHRLDVEDLSSSVTGEVVLLVKVDKKTTFRISKRAGKEEVLVIRTALKEGTLFKRMRDWFFCTFTFFYTPIFPDPGKKRTPEKQIREDYRALRRSLEKGAAWVQEKEKGELYQKVEGCITHAKQIEKALKGKNPKYALEVLASDWKGKSEAWIPSGYLNSQGVLQPLMLHFFQDGETCKVEFYNDATQNTGKVDPLLRWEISGDVEEGRRKILEVAFSGLLEVAPKRALGFSAIDPAIPLMTQVIEKKAAEKGRKISVGEEEVHKKGIEVRFQQLVSRIEEIDGVSPAPLNEEEQRGQAQPLNPAARITKFFSYLAENGALTKSHRLELTMQLTRVSVDDQLQQISKRWPLQRQLARYQECLDQIDHMQAKLLQEAGISEGAPLSFELQKRYTLIQKRKIRIQKKLRKQQREARGELLLSTHASGVRIPAPPVDKRGPLVSVQRGEATQRPRALIEGIERLEGLVSKPQLQALEKEYLLVALAPLFELAQKQLIEEKQRLEGLDLAGGEKQIKELEKRLEALEMKRLFPKKGEMDLQVLETLIEYAFVKSGFSEQITEAFNTSGRFPNFSSSKQFGEVLYQLILTPHYIPDHIQNHMYLLFCMQRMQTRSAKFSPKHMEAVNAFKALIQLREYVPQEVRTQESKKWREGAPVRFIEKGHEALLKKEKSRKTTHQAAVKRLEADPENVGLQAEEKRFRIEKELIEKRVTAKTLEEQKTAITETLALCEAWKADSTDAEKEEIDELEKAILKEKESFDSQAAYERYLRTHLDTPDMVSMDAQVGRGPVLEIGSSRKSLEEYSATFQESFTQTVEKIAQLKRCADAELDPTKKRALLKQVKGHSLHLLRKLPAPGTEGAFGTASLWSILSREGRGEVLEAVHQLEHLVWEAQLKLANDEMSGKERFQLIKAQAIRFALVREEIHHVRACVRNWIEEHPDQIDTFPFIVRGRNAIHFRWSEITHQEMKELYSKLPEGVNPGYLKLDRYSLGMEQANQLLTQELSACLSEDREIQRDLQALYAFIKADQTCGEEAGFQLGPDLGLREIRYQSGYRQAILGDPISDRKGRRREKKTEIREGMPPPFSCDTETFVQEIDQGSRAEMRRLFGQIEQGDLYYRTLTDPDQTLFGDDPEEGVPFFTSYPDLLLGCGDLELQISGKKEVKIVSGSEALVTVHPLGHPDQAYRISKKKKTHPLLLHNKTRGPFHLQEARTYATAGQWADYIARQAEKKGLKVPAVILQELMQIRSEVSDAYNGTLVTAYDPTTAMRALEFLTRAETLPYLHDTSIQQYLEESLFGSFLMQQALLDNPEAVYAHIDKLEEILKRAQAQELHVTEAFIRHIISHVNSQAKRLEEELVSHGYHSGILATDLPAFGGDSTGIMGDLLFTKKAMTQEGKREHFSVEHPVDPTQFIHPLIYRLNHLHRIVERTTTLVDERSIPTGEEIDAVQDPTKRLQLYQFALSRYRLSKEALDPKQLRDVLVGYQLLMDGQEEGSLPTQKEGIARWVREEILAQVEQLDSDTRDSLLSELLFFEMKRGEEKTTLQTVHWRQNKEDPYEFTHRGITLSLYTMEVESDSFASTRIRSVPLPKRLKNHRALQKALKRFPEEVNHEFLPGGRNRYTWSVGEDTFTLQEQNGKVVLRREIKSGVDAGNYLYCPIVREKMETLAELLVAENGIWRREEDPTSGRIWTDGGAPRTETNTYHVELSSEFIRRVTSTEGLLVSRSVRKGDSSPLLFARSEQLIILLDPKTKKPKEMRLKGTPLRFKKEGKQWVCYQGGERLGALVNPKDEDVCVQKFGKNWDQFIVALEGNRFVLLPYHQRFKKGGESVVDHFSLKEVSHLDVIEMRDGELMTIPFTSRLYLAHRLLGEAAQIKNSTVARRLYREATGYIDSLCREPPPDEIDLLLSIMTLIQHNPAVSPGGKMRPEALATALRLGLTLQDIRRKLSRPLSSREEHAEMESLYALYQIYETLKNKDVYAHFRKGDVPLHKSLFILTDGEIGALNDMGHQILKGCIRNAPLGHAGQIDEALEIPSIKQINPQFLLMLVRHAKPAETLDLNNGLAALQSRQSVNTLIENFWSYLTLIKKEKIKPEALQMLYEPSIFPPGKSGRELEILQAVDTQARQFLLYLAQINRDFGDASPLELAQEAINVMRGRVLRGAPYQEALLRAVDPAFETTFQTFITAVGDIEVEESVLTEDLPCPDFAKLRKDLNEASNKAKTFRNQLQTFIGQKNSVIQECKKEYATYEERIEKLEKAIENAESEREKKSLKGRLEEVLESQEIFLDKEIDTDFTRRSVLIDDSYQERYQIDNMRAILKQTQQLILELDKQIEKSNEMEEKLNLWNQVLQAMGALKDFTPHSWLSIPDSKEVGKLFQLEEGKVNTVSLAWSALKQGKLGGLLEAKKHLGTVSQRTQFKQQIENMLIVLGGIQAAVHIKGDPGSIQVEAPYALGESEEELFAHIQNSGAFTEGELATLESNLEKLRGKEQKTLLEGVAQALARHQKVVAMQIGLERSRKRLEAFKPVRPARDVPSPELEKLRRAINERAYRWYFCDAPEPPNEEGAFHRIREELVKRTVPSEGGRPVTDLKEGLRRLKDPLPPREIVDPNQLEALEEAIQKTIEARRASVETQEKECLKKLKQLPIKDLPKPLQQLRLRKGGDRELLVAALKAYRNGDFAREDLDVVIGNYLVDRTRLQVLTLAPRFSAMRSIEKLKELQKRKTEATEKELRAIDSEWKRESARIEDLLVRCQDFNRDEDFPKLLTPYVRKILYLQNRLGLVLRPDQLALLEEIVEKPAMLKSLRMGLGKTSVIFPFALEILASKGINPIGMVPRALFDTNFAEMDETTQAVFDLAGNQFLFTRQDAPRPFSIPNLHRVAQKCTDFLDALSRGEFVLTTIESKASLDDKIIEIESSLNKVIQAVKKVEEKLAETENPEKQATLRREREDLIDKSAAHETALDYLYKVKGVFEHENTRIIIDEVDQVARANYSVNAESGQREAPAFVLQNTIKTIFSLIRDLPELEGLRKELFRNNQQTLSEEAVNKIIKEIGKAWLMERWHLLPEEMHNEESLEMLLEWFAGQDPALPSAIDTLESSFSTELKAMRRGLNSSLRSALHLKIKLSGDWDPVHQAIGVPASQGMTSATTKFSDPMMQLALTYLITTYQAQGESFLQTNFGTVLREMKGRQSLIEKQLVFAEEEIEKCKEIQKKFRVLLPSERSSQKKEIQKNRRKLGRIRVEYERLIEEKKLLAKGIDQLRAIEERRREGETVHLAKELGGQDPVHLYIRYQFADQVANQKLIYVAQGQIIRPVQDALRGCYVIGLTGTATRNTEYIIRSRDQEAPIESTRITTAEVLYRMTKALPQGLDTPVQTYSLYSEKALEQFRTFAAEGSGYNFLVNQAGACDQSPLEEIIDALHISGKRPVVFVNKTPQGSYKAVRINGITKRLDALTPAERDSVAKRGFYYYHTQHVRGTHFDIPTGSKGALLLSPVVSADSRDQAAYRARELGEGHCVEPFISTAQHTKLRDKKGVVTLGTLFRAHHEHSNEEEKKEDLAAYQLHIHGLLKGAAERALKKAKDESRSWKDVHDPSIRETYLQKIRERSQLFALFEDFFKKDSGNELYLLLLERELGRGGTDKTDAHLKRLLAREIKKGEGLEQHLRKMEPTPAIAAALKEIRAALDKLSEEQRKISNPIEWAKMQPSFPEDVPAAPSGNQIEETEAEEEEEEEQEVTSETASESSLRQGAAQVLDAFDPEIMEETEVEDLDTEIPLAYVSRLCVPKDVLLHHGERMWGDQTAFTASLKRQMDKRVGRGLPSMRLVVAEQFNGSWGITAAPPFEGDMVLGLKGIPEVETLVGEPPNEETRKYLANGFVLSPTRNTQGELEFLYLGGTSLMRGAPDWKEKAPLMGQLILSMIYLGEERFSDDSWKSIEGFWEGISTQQKEQIQQAFEGRLATKNPTLYQALASHTWGKE